MEYIISDIHGEYELLVELLQKINFSEKDILYVLGDMVDKGRGSVKVLKLLKTLPNAHCILGNHEYLFLRCYCGLCKKYENDKEQLLKDIKNYFIGDGKLLTWEIIDWIDRLPFYIEKDNFICVHAGLSVNKDGGYCPLEEVDEHLLVYDRDFKDNANLSKNEKCVFFGHTPTRYITNKDEIILYSKDKSKPITIDNLQKVHLDTGAHFSGILGCFCVDTCECHYVKKEPTT